MNTKEKNNIKPQIYYKHKIKFLEKHWAFLSSLLLALVVFLNYIFKVYEFSKAEAMYIDRSWIEFDSQYVIYSLMKSCLFIFIYATYNYIIYYVITSCGKNKLIASAILGICLYFLTVLLLFGVLIAVLKINPFMLLSDNTVELVAFMIVTFFAALFMSCMGLYFSFEKIEKKPSKKSTKTIKMELRNAILVFLAMFLVLFSFLIAIDLGSATAATNKEYKIYSNYVVLAEYRNRILCSKIENDSMIDGKRVLEFDCKKQYVFTTVESSISTTVQSYDIVISNSKTFIDFLTGGFS